MKNRLKFALIASIFCAVTGYLMMQFLLVGANWTDPRVIKFAAVWAGLGFGLGMLLFYPPRPFRPHPSDILTVDRATVQKFHDLAVTRLNGTTWSDNDDLREMEHITRRMLEGTVIRRGQSF